MPGALFADESKHRGFRFAAVVIDSKNVAAARAQMRTFLLPGLRRMHFVSESNGRRKLVLRVISNLPLDISIVECADLPRRPGPRERGINALTTLCLARDVRRLVLETDLHTIDLDRRAIASRLRDAGATEPLEYTHMTSSQEPLLWIADAIAWSWSRGGEWKRAIMDLGPAVIRG